MILNYLRITWRYIARKKGYSFINISGLTLGMACCFVIFKYVAFEYSYDRFHDNRENLYRVNMSWVRADPEAGAGAFTPQAMGPALADEIPEIQQFTRISPDRPVISSYSYPDRIFEEERVFYVDQAFFEMFSFPVINGNPELNPGSIMVSETTARKYFGSGNAIGEMLSITGQATGIYKVSGIFKDVPANSHLQFDVLLPIYDLLQIEQYTTEPEGGWSWNNFLTYIQLHQDMKISEVQQKMNDVVLAIRGEAVKNQGYTLKIGAQPLNDVYLNADVVSFAVLSGNYRTVYFFMVIGLITLIIALVNYVNLATARAIDRAREVGVRKILGARRKQLITQFFFESALTNFFAIIFALVLTELFQPIANSLWGVKLILPIWSDGWFLSAVLIIFVMSTLLAGLYPAYLLSSFKPVSVLKGRTGSFLSLFWLRKGLVILQFSAAVALMGGTAVVFSQINYMRSLDTGLDMEQVLIIPGPRLVPEGTNLEEGRITLVEELRKLPGVRQVATSRSLPGRGFNWGGASTWRTENDETSAISGMMTYVDTNFISLYGIEVIAGRNFDVTTAPFGGSTSEVLINETMARSLGFTSSEEALDKTINIGSGSLYPGYIIGVMKDFNWSSAHEIRENITFGHTKSGDNISIRLVQNDLRNTIESVEEIFTIMFPGSIFSYSFLDETFNAQYQDDQSFATLFTFFAGLAIIIACLGLFGLASFTAVQRTKEIGMRKILGASVTSLATLISKDFLKLVVIAILVGSPVSWYLLQKWLQNFAYRIEISPLVYLFVGLLSIIIALATVAWQSIRAATSDPVECLRTE
jgi:putative ABC transport system permease protein